MSSLIIVRPNLGNPLVLAPHELERFEITIACEKDPYNESENNVIYTDTKTVHSNLKAYPPSISWGNVVVPLKIYRVHSYFRHPSYTANYSAVRHAQTSVQQQYLNGFRWEMKADVGIAKQDIEKLKDLAGWPTLLNLVWSGHGKTNSHALYIHETIKSSNELTILHITDPHIARRNDFIPELLCEVRNKKECDEIKKKYVNFNDHLRAFIKKANEKVNNGKNVIVVLTGDITDYYFDGYWDGWFICGQHGKAKDKRKEATGSSWGYSNIEKFREIILGLKDEKGERLRCPIFTVPGNHEYYANEILLDFNVGSRVADTFVDAIAEREEYGAFFKSSPEPTEEEKEEIENCAREYDFWAYPRPGGKHHILNSRYPNSISLRNTFKEAIRNKGDLGSYELNLFKKWRANLVDNWADKSFWLLKPKSWILSQYLRTVNYDLDFEFKLGNHHFLCLNTGYDLYPGKWEIKDPTTKPHRDFKEGGPHSRGITAEHLKMVKQTLKGDEEKMIYIFTHAPLIGMEKGEKEGIECLYEDTLKKDTSEVYGKARSWLNVLYQPVWEFLGKIGKANTVISEVPTFVPPAKPQPSIKIPWKNGMFKYDKLKPCLDYYGADGKVVELLNIITNAVSKVTNKPVLVLSGHTHKVHEFRIKKCSQNTTSCFYYFIDNYSSKYFPFTKKVLALMLRAGLLKNYSPLLLTAGALKNKEPQYREVIVKEQSIASLEIKDLKNIEKTANFTPGRQTIALRTHNGQYVCAENGGTRDLIADRNLAREWETFELVKLEDNHVALMACNRKFVRAKGGGGDKLKPDRHWIKDHETFLMENKGENKIALRAHNGKYVCAEGGGGQELIANRKNVGEWETFTLVNLE